MAGTKYLLSIVLYVLIATILAVYSFAEVSTPNFPECNHPQGKIIAHYDSGTHGIPGSAAEYVGSDTVYLLNPNTLMQCFCSTNGNGIQTNWWKISSISDADVEILKNLGWVYIPTGALWGLQDTPYMAIDSPY